MLRFWKRRVSVIGWAILSIAPGCSEGHQPDDCSDSPTYRLVVTAAQGALPPDLKLRVEYDAGCEIYSLKDGAYLPCVDGGETGILICTPEYGISADASADAGTPATKISCNVWNAGAGTVTVLSSEYPEAPLGMGRDGDGCGPFEVPIVLVREDASP